MAERLTTKTHHVEVLSSVENLVGDLLQEHWDTLSAYCVVLLPVGGQLLRTMAQFVGALSPVNQIGLYQDYRGAS